MYNILVSGVRNQVPIIYVGKVLIFPVILHASIADLKILVPHGIIAN
jgi:hypothetical protein